MTLRRLIILAAGVLSALPAPAFALSLAVQQSIGLSASAPSPDYSIDFRLGSATGWSNTRASTAMAANRVGLWTDFATTTVRVTNRGALVENTKTNIVKFNNDATNVLWVKSNATAALDQTGIDGAVNGASSVLATAANATVLQTIVSGSASRQPSAFVKRLIGTGPVDMTIDNAVSWVSIAPCASTVALGMPECRVYIPPQTLANPTIGFRLQTSGDKIAVAGVQSENTSLFPSSPIFVGATNVTRAADLITRDAPPTFTDRVTIAVSVTQDFALAAFPTTGAALSVDDGTTNERLSLSLNNAGTAMSLAVQIHAGGGATAISLSPSPPRGLVRTTMIASFTPGLVMFSVNGGPITTMVTSVAFPTGLTQVHIGTLGAGTQACYCYVESIGLWKDVALNEPQLRSWWNGR